MVLALSNLRSGWNEVPIAEPCSLTINVQNEVTCFAVKSDDAKAKATNLLHNPSKNLLLSSTSIMIADQSRISIKE